MAREVQKALEHIFDPQGITGLSEVQVYYRDDGMLLVKVSRSVGQSVSQSVSQSVCLLVCLVLFDCLFLFDCLLFLFFID